MPKLTAQELAWVKPAHELLTKGLVTISAVQKSLNINRHQAKKIVAHLKELNSRTHQRVSGLSREHLKICQWVTEGKGLGKIHELLAGLQIFCHPSTVSRYIKAHCHDTPPAPCTSNPGETAYVSVLRVGRGKKTIYVFCFLLAYSRYSYFSVLKHYSMEAFLQCHADCFNRLSGVPKCILLCDSSCLSLTVKDIRAYRTFLCYHYCCLRQLPPLSRQKELCMGHTARVKKEISTTFFHVDIKKILRSLQQKHMHAFNLCIHPVTEKPIYKVFQSDEKGKLQPLPALPYPISCERKVSIRGRVRLFGKDYLLEDKFKGKMVSIRLSRNQLVFSWRAKTIARFVYIL